MPLLHVSCAWLLGIYLGAKISFPLSSLLFSLAPVCLLPFLFQYRSKLLLLTFCLLAFFGATFRFQTAQPVVNEQHLAFYNNRGVVEITGLVSNDPESRNTTQSIHLSASEIRIDNQVKKISGTALLRTAIYPEYYYGDILKVTGKLEIAPTFADFDYKGYLERQGIYSIINYPKIEILDKRKGSKLLQWLYSFRNHLSQVLKATLPEPQGALARGITLGMRSDIPSSLS